MAEYISMYRDTEPGIIVYHNTGQRPAISIPHLHSQYEIYYNISGADSFFFDNKFYTCHGRDLFVVPKVCVHKVIQKHNTHYDRCIISIDSRIISSINSSPYTSGLLSWIDYVGDSLPGRVNLKTDAEHEAFLKLIDEYQLAGDDLLRFAVVTKILAFVGNLFKETAPVPSIEPQSIAEGALLIIEENFKDIKISDIAKKLYVNDSHLSRIFKEKHGVTLSNYLIMRKLAEAKKCIYMGISVKEACFLSGFNNYSNFIRTFKKFEGASPGKFTLLNDPI